MPCFGAASTTRRTASTPASCPRRRGNRRRVAHRPLPSMMMPTCSLEACSLEACSLEERLLCITKFPCKKRARLSDGKDAEPRVRGVFLPGSLGCIAHEAFEHREIVEKAATAVFRQTAARMRSVALITLGDLDQPGFLQHLEVPAEVAVGETAELLEIGEGQSLGVGDQRGEHAEPGLLVNDPVKSFVGERGVAGISLRHRDL